MEVRKTSRNAQFLSGLLSPSNIFLDFSQAGSNEGFGFNEERGQSVHCSEQEF